MRVKFTVALLVIACFTLLTACSDEAAAPAAADTAFAQDMSMHAASAMDLADQARTRSDNPQTVALADEVFEAVGPIADQLTDLGPALAADGADGFAHEDSLEHLTQSGSRTEALRATSAKKFDNLFKTSLILELREGLKIAEDARDDVTDSRSKAIADAAASTWAALVESSQKAV